MYIHLKNLFHYLLGKIARIGISESKDMQNFDLLFITNLFINFDFHLEEILISLKAAITFDPLIGRIYPREMKVVLYKHM